MKQPDSKRKEQKQRKYHFKKHEDGELKRAASEKTVNSSKDKHPDCVCERVGKQAINSGAPVIEDVLGELFVDVEGKEATDYRKPQDGEVEKVAENIEYLVFGSEAKAQKRLGEHEEEKVLKVSIKEDGRQKDQRAEGSENLRYFVVEKKVEAQLKK